MPSISRPIATAFTFAIAFSMAIAAPVPIDATPSPFTDTPCNVARGPLYMPSRDIASADADDFCKQGLAEARYNANDPNEVVFRVTNSNDPLLGANAAPNCASAFGELIDSCNGNDPVYNPSNFKYGGSKTIDGWFYEMVPQANNPPVN
ncbi:hypothetical protein BJ875DRAFT_481242 [Amylocarpus encephaloides]|uniref:Ecp2 effector protein domain-containing protein n=1 Tax=Amylocarpus encephaloides TaxID=45428 RepID=A0A9P8C853_9HELO|nr:hypothetical protein BJ875DRAFT_481242 [Amylocarpus encephaloides]